MTKQITLVVADDHPMLLKGLVEELKDFNYVVLASVSNGAMALEKIISLKPMIAILDIEMPLLNGFEVIKKCREKNISTKIIILTSHKERGFIFQANKLNIKGYIMKDEPFIEVHRCIQNVYKGDTYFSSVFSNLMDIDLSQELNKIKFLTPSERTIVRLLAQGLNSKKIGEQLSISPRTVEKHRANIITKLQLPSSRDALASWVNENKEIIASF
ncbi:response regulator transcription factor [Winogradskyella aquimaris]|uniref:Response regulator transcription factor n=1 Tax=Winogradskyella aquimaris TaxID=864074 RepID=A0ABU5ESH1_9FLAO|nr:response regulator transcription factor [Winogradskyella aquimaris]MDY2588498.1 response regulator transcription factor [Winogradskyella aquimaris]